MSNSPELLKHLKDRAKYLKTLKPEDKEARTELLTFVQKTTDNLEAKQNQITSESNQFERQYTSFFILSISFIVAGMLSSPPETDTTVASRFFYFASITAALIATAFLFLEYILVKKFFRDWGKHNTRTLEHVAGDDWGNPSELEEWMNKHDTKAPTHSTIIVLAIEIFLIFVAITLLGCWVYESMFNPDWPHINFIQNVVDKHL